MKTGIDELRAAVRLFDNCVETFNQRFTATQLVALWRIYSACGWDITPDQWSEQQVKRALDGFIPVFSDDGCVQHGGPDDDV